MKKLIIVSTLTSLFAASAAMAGDLTVVGGVATFESPYKNFDDDTAVYLDARYKEGDFSIDERGLNYRVLGTDDTPLNIHATLTSAGDGYDTDDSTVFTGMDERDGSLDLGVSADYALGDGQVKATLVHDITNNHEGFVADVNYSHDFELDYGLTVVPRAGVAYTSEDYTNYYFGVRQSEATGSRAAYNADSALNPYVGYRMTMPLAGSWSLVHEAAYVWLDDEITDSSLVDRDSAWVAALGVGYTF